MAKLGKKERVRRITEPMPMPIILPARKPVTVPEQVPVRVR